MRPKIILMMALYSHLGVQTGEIYAAPVSDSQVSDQAAEKSTTLSPLLSDQGNFIENEGNFSEFLKKSEQEIRESIKMNPKNYAHDEMPIEEIMALIEAPAKTEQIAEKDTCPICKDDLDTEQIHETSCRHKFHTNCYYAYTRFVSIPSQSPRRKFYHHLFASIKLYRH